MVFIIMKFFLQSSIFLKLVGFIWALAGLIATIIIGLTYGIAIIAGVVIVLLVIMGIVNLIKVNKDKNKTLNSSNSNNATI